MDYFNEQDIYEATDAEDTGNTVYFDICPPVISRVEDLIIDFGD
jgi:hypothetical protein